MRTIDNNAIRAKNDIVYREEFIHKHEDFILHIIYRVTNRYSTKSHDSWSVAISAFDEGINSYQPDRGSFIPFVELVIKRRLYDHIKKQSRKSAEVLVDPLLMSGGHGHEVQVLPFHQELMEKTTAEWEDNAKWEIEAITEVLDNYGFRFQDLVSVSPKAEKTKIACAKAVAYMIKDSELLARMRAKKTLPIKEIENDLNVPRKVLERHRKYIIAAAEIVSGNYPVLAGYMNYIKRELIK